MFGCRFESRRGRLFYALILFLVIGYAGSVLFTNLSYLVLMVVCFVFFSLSSFEGRIGPVLGPLRGPRPGQICPWPTLHARSLDARDAQRSSAASRGGRLNGGVLELSSRCVKGILVFGGGMKRGEGGEKISLSE